MSLFVEKIRLYICYTFANDLKCKAPYVTETEAIIRNSFSTPSILLGERSTTFHVLASKLQNSITARVQIATVIGFAMALPICPRYFFTRIRNVPAIPAHRHAR